MSDPIVGIDLGTSNSVVAHVDRTGKVGVLADDGGYKSHPSVVSFHPSGGVVVGAAAKQRKVIDPHNTIYSVKRLIGRGFRSPEVQIALSRVPYQIKEGEHQLPLITTRAGAFAIPEISAIVLDYVRGIATARLGTPITRAVVTVPASFNDAQRSATATAGSIAGLSVVRVLNEPTAAALAYGHTRNLREVIAVYDFGGGTFDITILRLEDQVYEVLGTAGDTFLGGDDLDERIVDKMVAKFLAEHRVDLRTNEVSMMRLRAVAEQTKIELSRRSRAVVRIDEIAYGPRGVPLDLKIEITRDEFVSQVADIIDRTFPVCQEALALAGLGIDSIADVILVGGTTKIPYVRDQVSKFFAKAPRTDVNPEDAVAAGAALQASFLERGLARRGPSLAPVAQAELDEDPTAESRPSEFAELAEDATSGATMAPLETAPGGRRVTSSYAARTAPASEPKPDTSYAVTRSGTRDIYEQREPPPVPPALPLARLTRSPTAPPPSRRTQLGVPTVQPPPVPKPRTARGQAVPRDPTEADAIDPGGFDSLDETHTFSGLTTAPPADPAAAVTATGTRALADPADAAVTATGLTRARADPADAAVTATGLTRGLADPAAVTATALSDAAVTATGLSRALSEPADAAVTATGLALSEPADAAVTATGLSRALSDPAVTATGLTPAVPAAPPHARTMLAVDPVDPVVSPGRLRLSSDFEETGRSHLPGDREEAGRLRLSSDFEAGRSPLPDDFEEDDPARLSPASTAKGFQPPQTFPAAMPAGTAPPRRAGPLLLEVTPRGLGIGTVAGFCEELIRRNSGLPAELKKLFTTSRDRQAVVRIVVCQGESRRLDQNLVIGDLVLRNLPPRPRGETSIEVTFSLDASGILQVRARDAETGAEQSAALDLLGGMQQEAVAASRDRLAALRR